MSRIVQAVGTIVHSEDLTLGARLEAAMHAAAVAVIEAKGAGATEEILAAKEAARQAILNPPEEPAPEEG